MARRQLGREAARTGLAGIACGALTIIAGLAVAGGLALPTGALTPASALTSAKSAGGTGIGATPEATPNAVSGTDVSYATGALTAANWAQVAQGNDFVGVETRQGMSVSLVNPNYGSQVTGAIGAGLYVMPYVFADPGKVAPQDQFADAWTVISSVTSPADAPGGKYLPIALDLEWDTVNFPTQECYGLTTAAMVTWISDFIQAAEAQEPGMTPVIYTSQQWWDDCTGGSSEFSADPLWLASYDAVPQMPAGWPAYTFWQSSNSATVSGITGKADVDQLQTAPELVTSQVGANFSVQVQALNMLAGQAGESYTASGLPPGLAISATTGVISGQLSTSTSAAGSYQVQVTVTDSTVAPVPSSVSFTLDVYAPLTLTAPASVTTTAGAPASLQVGASDQNQGATGYTPPVFSASGLPGGTSISPTGLITGWPATPGSYHVTVSAMDGLHAVASAGFTWAVRAAGDSGTTGAIRQQGGSGKCLDDPSGKTTSGTAIDLATCNGKSNQTWTLVQDGSIRVLGHCLAASGSHVLLYPCDGSIAGQWRAGTDGALVSARYGSCLNGPSGAVANGTKPTLAACTNSTAKVNQHWTIPLAPVVSGVGARCLGAASAVAELSNCGNYSAQHWLVAANAQIVVQSSNCLTESDTAVGSPVSIAKCANAASQHWKLVTAGVIADEIQSTASGLCATVPSATSGAGTQLVLGACSTALTATWRVQ